MYRLWWTSESEKIGETQNDEDLLFVAGSVVLDRMLFFQFGQIGWSAGRRIEPGAERIQGELRYE